MSDVARAKAAKRKREAASAQPAALKTYISPTEFSRRSGVHLATVYRRVDDGTLKHRKLIGAGKRRGRLMIDASELD
jgi:hypothetical protein